MYLCVFSVYLCCYLCSNFGPNTTTFVIPGEIYPSEVRATCHGLSAACGKLGAATGAYCFPLLLNAAGSANGMRYAMYACACIAYLGVIVTWLLIPRYSGDMLAEEGVYLALEWDCLVPSTEDIDSYYAQQKKTNELLTTGGYEMLQVIHAAHEYDLDQQEEEGEEEEEGEVEEGESGHSHHGGGHLNHHHSHNAGYGSV